MDNSNNISFEKLKMEFGSNTDTDSDNTLTIGSDKIENTNKIVFRNTPKLFLVYDKEDNLYNIYVQLLKKIKLTNNINSMNFINLIIKIIEYIDKEIKIDINIEERKNIVMNIIELWIKVNVKNIDEKKTMLGLMNKLVPSTIDVMVGSKNKKCCCPL